ncbi:hypothetical protein GH664_03155 [Thauera sp. 2A1]|nr:hypothetical protein GH664_03155 [Thauera sp. 2A1]
MSGENPRARDTRGGARPPVQARPRQLAFPALRPHLPASLEFVLFDRSWYSRASVDGVMGFCSSAEYDDFMETSPDFDHVLVRTCIKLFKYCLDISQAEQKKRRQERRKDPLKQWELSPIDAEALKHWADYSQARNEMFARTRTLSAPWTMVRPYSKEVARIDLLKDLLMRLRYEGKDCDLVLPNPAVVLRMTRHTCRTCCRLSEVAFTWGPFEQSHYPPRQFLLPGDDRRRGRSHRATSCMP